MDVTSARTDVKNVRLVLDTSLEDEAIELAILVANRIITAEFSGTTLTSAQLQDIETYLAAHFASLRDPRMRRENIAGEWSYEVLGDVGIGLRATFHGQTAILLDTTGVLGKLSDGPKRARITVLKDVT